MSMKQMFIITLYIVLHAGMQSYVEERGKLRNISTRYYSKWTLLGTNKTDIV